MDHQTLNDWFRENARDLPWRHPEFSAWGTLVSEIMLQQTQASRVAVEIERWLERWPTPAALAAADTAEVLRMWGNLGYPRRALRLQEGARQVVEQHDGMVPDDLGSLLALPGVGDYTARAVLAFHFGRRVPVVDTNVRRVIARHVQGVADQGAPRRADLADVEQLLPHDESDAAVFSAALMELGALVCTPTPDCGACPVREGCAWHQAGAPDNAPKKRKPQPRFEGSDRQVRGKIMRRLRNTDIAIPRADLRILWDDGVQFERALESLLADGLAVETDSGIALP